VGRAARSKTAPGGTATGTVGSRSENARRKAADLRAVQRRTQVRRRLLVAGGGVALVIVLVVVAALVGRSSRAGQPTAKAQAPVVIPEVAADLGSVPSATLDSVGAGTATGLKAISGAPLLTAGGKPEILYIGGEFCPYCAAERWALAVALSRFGTLSGLHFIHSSPTDGYIPTLSFYKSGYTSKYLSFDPVEWYGEADDASTPFGHVYLQQPTAQEAALFQKYAASSLPFVDIGNRYLLPYTQYNPADLSGLTWAQIATDMRNPSSQVARDIDGAANSLTAAICSVTDGQPGGVCTSAGVRAAGSLCGRHRRIVAVGPEHGHQPGHRRPVTRGPF
jgi:Domain of unknown function (DUF929)